MTETVSKDALDTRVVAEYGVYQAEEAAAVAELTGDYWDDLILVYDLVGSWQAFSDALLPAVTNAQYRVAANAVAYHDYWQRAYNLDGGTEIIDPRALAGVEQTGGNAATWGTYNGVIETLKRITAGETPEVAMLHGKRVAQDYAHQVVQDAADEAYAGNQILRQRERRDGTDDPSRDKVGKGWVWITLPPACARCLVLNGRDDYLRRPRERHPNCDCTVAPTLKRHGAATVNELMSHEQLYGLMSEEQQINSLGAERAGAVAAGKMSVYEAAKQRQRPRQPRTAKAGAGTVREARLSGSDFHEQAQRNGWITRGFDG